MDEDRGQRVVDPRLSSLMAIIFTQSNELRCGGKRVLRGEKGPGVNYAGLCIVCAA